MAKAVRLSSQSSKPSKPSKPSTSSINHVIRNPIEFGPPQHVYLGRRNTVNDLGGFEVRLYSHFFACSHSFTEEEIPVEVSLSEPQDHEMQSRRWVGFLLLLRLVCLAVCRQDFVTFLLQGRASTYHSLGAAVPIHLAHGSYCNILSYNLFEMKLQLCRT